MFDIKRKTIEWGGKTLTLETGRMARQADGAVLATYGKTMVLATAVYAKSAKPGQDFFPLTVNYQEKFYAAGRIPGSFHKREGRPSEKETLTSRLIDRPIRPLFPEGFVNEVQVIATVMSTDKKTDPDIAAMLGASAALAISGIPFLGPIAGARVGYRDGMYILNPNYKDLETSQLELVVAGTDEAVLMVESEAQELTEAQMLGAVLFGHMEMQVAVNAIKEFAKEAGKPPMAWKQPVENTALKEAVNAYAGQVTEAYLIRDKQARYTRIGEIKSAAIAALCNKENPAALPEQVVKNAFGDL